MSGMTDTHIPSACACGGKASLHRSRDDEVSWVKCDSCGDHGTIEYRDDVAVLHWNSGKRRSPSSLPTVEGENKSLTACDNCGRPAQAFRPMDTWDQRDEIVLLLVDYREDGEHALDDATVAVTVGHNNDHNVGEGEGQGWQFAGWCWSHDHYVEGKGKPIGWLPLTDYHQHARAVETLMEAAS